MRRPRTLQRSASILDCARKTCRWRILCAWLTQSRAARDRLEKARLGGSGVSPLDELDLVAIRIGNERDNGRPVLHRTGFPRHRAAAFPNLLARLTRVVHFD